MNEIEREAVVASVIIRTDDAISEAISWATWNLTRFILHDTVPDAGFRAGVAESVDWIRDAILAE